MKLNSGNTEQYLRSKYGTRWLTKVIYVDIDTGEELTKHRATTEYNIINTKRESYVNPNNKAWGRITLTNECRRSNQLRLF